MNILVTGGSGYVGSHICVKLLTLGFKVIVIDNLINSQIKALTRVSEIVNINLNFDLKEDACFTFIKGDVCDKNPLVKIFAFCQIDAVIHLSGLKSVRESVENPVKYHSNNVDGSLNLFNIMQEFNCKTIIFSSSATVYGATKEVPISENSQLFPSNPYGVNKKSIEDILKNLYNSNNSWHIAILRFFNGTLRSICS